MRPWRDDSSQAPVYRAVMASRRKVSVWLSALLIGVFQVGGSYGAATNQPEMRPIDGLALVLLVAGPLALAVRDRRPLVAVAVSVASVVVYFWLGYPYGPIVVSLVVAIFSAIQAGRRSGTWILVGLGYLGLLALVLLAPRPGVGAGFGHLFAIPGWLGVVLVVAEIVRIRRQQTAEQERAKIDERERRASEQRLHLAQELHDVLAHNISLINVQASVALHLLDDQPDQARPALASIKGASREALHELRTALDLLRRGGEDAPLVPAPRLADLDSLVAGVRAGGLDVSFHQGEPPPVLPEAVELAAYRIVQEALTNVTRHARATAVVVSVEYGDGVTIRIVDDGIGGDAGTGNGITGMRSRAAALGGTLEAGPGPDGGFLIVAHLPGDEP